MVRSILVLSTLVTLGCGHHRRDCDDGRTHDRGGAPSHGERGRHGDSRHGDGRHGDGRHGDDRGEGCDLPEEPADAAPPDAGAARDVATPGCRSDRDCAAAGAGLACDGRSGACVAPTECAADAHCDPGKSCLAGRCVTPAEVCQFATDCGGGRDCVDGRCLAACGAGGACPATQECVGGWCDRPARDGGACAVARDCGEGAACSLGRCVAACDASRPCGEGLFCNAGFCELDTAPRSFCARDADCAGGSVCRRGRCRAACPRGTREECLRVDAAFDTCGADRLCTNAIEQRPDCARGADCAAPARCVNALCR